MPHSTCSNVVLPEPDGPQIAVCEPGGNSRRSISSTFNTPPRQRIFHNDIFGDEPRSAALALRHQAIEW